MVKKTQHEGEKIRVQKKILQKHQTEITRGENSRKSVGNKSKLSLGKHTERRNLQSGTRQKEEKLGRHDSLKRNQNEREKSRK